MIKVSKESGLTKRQKTIIQMLAQFTFSNPVTVQVISEKLKLSSRTILRELPKIENWMEENDFHMVRKPRVGIYIDEDAANRALILELVKADRTKNSAMDKEERLCYIEHEILAAQEPLKFFYFTSKFGISEGTLSSDLEEVEKWMNNYGLSLIRRKGLGIYWTGSEQDYRQAVVALINMELSQEATDPSISKKEKHAALPLFSLYSEEMMSSARDLIRSVEQNLKTRYTDNSFQRMSLSVLVTMKRMQMGFLIEDFATDIEILMRYPEYQAATWVASTIEVKLNVTISPEEIAFIAMQLLSAKVWKPQMEDKCETENIKNRQLVIHMILKVEQLLDMEFLDDRMLIDGLCNHIGPAISRIKMHVHIENNNVGMLKEKYSYIFEAVKTASNILKEEINVDTIDDEELGFIALHFCAAAEKQKSESSKVSVIVACPNGIGTSHMLAVHIQKAFPEIMVRKVISASEIDKQYLIDKGIELVVSTVQMNLDFPHVCVNPVLLQNDQMVIKNAIKDLKKNKVEPKGTMIRKKRVRRNEINYFVTLGGEILQVIENIKIASVDSVNGKDELVAEASNLFARNDHCAEVIEHDIREREKLAGTYISTFQMLFLHCKTKAVIHCRFGYISLKNPLLSKEGTILGAIVMLVPDDSDEEKIYQEIMSEVSGSMAENDQIINNLINKKRNEVSFELEKSLGNYYQCIMKEYGEI
ncbi:MAG: BglG family transcription antiterminator [Lachnospiraceae bacterium]|nr:BglG family transcription antiterminator [Lachnospiraceae bacterium]